MPLNNNNTVTTPTYTTPSVASLPADMPLNNSTLTTPTYTTPSVASFPVDSSSNIATTASSYPTATSGPTTSPQLTLCQQASINNGYLTIVGNVIPDYVLDDCSSLTSISILVQ